MKTRPAAAPRSPSRPRVRAAVEPHGRRHDVRWNDRETPIVEPGAVHVEPRTVQPLGHLQGQLGGTQHLLRTVRIGQRARDVPRHRGERGTGGDQRIDVLVRPVPDLHLEAQLRDPADPFDERQIQEHHLGATRPTGMCSHQHRVQANRRSGLHRFGRGQRDRQGRPGILPGDGYRPGRADGVGEGTQFGDVGVAQQLLVARGQSGPVGRPAPENTIPVLRPSPIVAMPPEPNTSPRMS